MTPPPAEFHEHQRGILDAVRPVVHATALFVVGFLFVAVANGRPLLWPIIQAITALGMSVGILERYPSGARATSLCVGLHVLAIGAMLHYGPLVGGGLMIMAAALSAAYFLGRNAAIVSVAVLVCALYTPVLGLPTWLSDPAVTLPQTDAIRTATAATLSLVASVVLFVRVHNHTLRAIAARSAAAEQREALARERERMADAAAASQRLESLGRLAGGMAHDFNNALSVILAGIEDLQTDPIDRDQILADIATSARSAADTSRRLLTFASTQPTNGACSPVAQIEGFVPGVRRVLPPNVPLVLDLEAVGRVPLDAGELDQVLLNLVLNARDAMPQGGTITVRCRRRPPLVTIEVVDTGVGMTKEVQDRIFEPFFTTKGPSGTGLGLATVWGTLTRVGGHVDVDSTLGQGTTFRLSLPELPDGPTDLQVARPLLTPVEGRGVLVVEDDPAMRRALERSLRAGGYDVVSEETIPEARRHVAGPFDALVTDAHVPGGDVPALIEAFRRAHPGRPVVVCSGAPTDQLRAEGFHQPDLTFLPKPFSTSDLLDVLVRSEPTPVSGPH